MHCIKGNTMQLPIAYPQTRLRRLRRTAALRSLVRETHLANTPFIQPLFIRSGINIKQAIDSMPGQFQWSVDQVIMKVQRLWAQGIGYILLFGIPPAKDAQGQGAYAADGIIQQAIYAIKQHCPQMMVITDVCYCEYTDHGHCGYLPENSKDGNVDNDRTLNSLAKQA